LSLGLVLPLVEEPRVKAFNHWQLRLTEVEFSAWRFSKQKHNLFFDGASKGNLGEAGGGGIILNLEGNLERKYSWGLICKSNNITEALALSQGLNQLLIQYITKVNVFRDSQSLIGLLNSNKNSNIVTLNQVLRRLRDRSYKFKELKFFRVFRLLNGEVEKAANWAINLEEGELEVNFGPTSWDPVP